MPKPRRKPPLPKDQELPGIYVVDEGKFARECTASIKELLNENWAKFSRLPERGKITYKLTGPSAERALTDENLEIMRLHVTESTTYWLAASMEIVYDERATTYLNEVSLTVFRGNTMQERERLLRAEWHCHPKFAESGHAQPHWHVYPSRLEEMIRAPDAEAEDLKLRDLIDHGIPEEDAIRDFILETSKIEKPQTEALGTWAEGDHFHYAMTAGWLTGMGVSHDNVSEMQVVTWIKLCVEYIQQELRHVETKRRRT